MKSGLTFKLNKEASKNVFSANLNVDKEVAQIEKDVEQFLKKELPQDTINALLQKANGLGMKALKIREKIKLIENNIKQIQTKSSDKTGRGFLLKKQYSLLAQCLKEGYAFVMNLRKQLTNEKLGYAIRIARGAEETLGIYSMEEMLSMTTLVKNTQGDFALAFKNIKTINKFANEQNKFIKKNGDSDLVKILQTILSANKEIRKQVYSARKAWNDSHPDAKDKISIYYRGLNGFILERAFIAIAKKENISLVSDVTPDTDRYSSGGDLQGAEVPPQLKNALEKLGKEVYDNLEVKNITDFGASLVNLNTLIKDLDKIIEICLDFNNEDINSKLITNIFKNPKKLQILKSEFFKEIDTALKSFENNI